MTYRELLYKSVKLLDSGKITIGEYEHMTKPLDRQVDSIYLIREEIEKHRRKTQSIDHYDLVGDCLDIIDSIWRKTNDL